MGKSGIILIVATILIMFGGAYIFSKPVEIPELSGYEYYWGDGCPHCKIVIYGITVSKYFMRD